jgi:hypothetical protein
MQKSSFIQLIKPGVPKRYLFFIAAFVWTFAGVMLLYRGFKYLVPETNHGVIKLMLIFISGILFYVLLFSRISRRHTDRIHGIDLEKPCLFSFFNIRSYLLMSVMISSGIVLRTTGIVNPEYLSMVYITMGIPLLLSSVRFYYNGIRYKHSKQQTTVLN